MRKAKLRKKYLIKRPHFNFKTGDKIVILLIIFIASLLALFSYVNKKVAPILLNYAELEVRKIATLIINRAITKQVAEAMTIDELFLITKNEQGEIMTIDFNPILVNKVLSQATNSVQLDLKHIEEGSIDLIEMPDNVLIDYDKEKIKKGIIYEIPAGVIFNNALLSNLGPKIPVRLNLVGDITSGVNTKLTNYGINNALVEVSVNISLNEQVILPFTSSQMKVEMNVPVALKLIQGNIPSYYFNGIDKNSANFALSLE